MRCRSKAVRSRIVLPEGGPEIEADLTSLATLALHRPVDGGKGYVLTHAASGRAVLRTKLRKDAQEARKILEALDWSDPAAIRGLVEEIRRRF